ncbi:MarR family winged helix-turn-helix transcriptional regulator [Sporolactobacillus laevolacticus]|uniref:MarR family winged helix-turn-helix transcriptional regulator n=1 Tax=Sporolactobacillus laevolacticus TaxID=33018 RepID=UPI0025B38206|nr:MarR family transcriptional regulator [Sporolactobacillus laevolacticus]MDN3954505.1 MarR family transcriptional regulator [Sporolactobacillus laevolacticus]
MAGTEKTVLFLFAYSLISNYNIIMKTDNAFNLLARIHEKVNKKLISSLNEYGITDLVPSHGDILAALFKKDCVTMMSIAQLIHRDKSTVTQLVKKLVKKDYVFCKDNPQDHRSSLVCLTDKGNSLKEIFQKISRELYETAYEGLTPDEIANFHQLVKKIHNNF